MSTDLELAFLRTVYTLCIREKVFVHHCNDARRCVGNGWPDLVLIGQHGLLFRECKVSPVDRLRPEQVSVLYLLKANGQDAKVWTSADLKSGAVASEIEAIS